MRAVVLAAIIVTTVITGCGDNRAPTTITIVVPTADPALASAVSEMAVLTGYPRIDVIVADAGPQSSNQVGGERIVVVPDPLACDECFDIQIISGDWPAYEVRAGGLLGAQYGVAAALETLGFRFRSPFETYLPPTLHGLGDPLAGKPGRAAVTSGEPAVRVRGFQLHTLHPIESYFAFWEPGEANLDDARRIIDWTIKNRGNFVQWVGLDDIMDPTRHAAWKTHTRAIIDYAHARGVRVGLNLQLYGQSNLQQAFDLWDDRNGGVTLDRSIAERMPLITDGVAFDVYDLSFGEFFNSDPAQFVADVNAVAAALRVHAPSAEMHAVVHVGDDQRVDYMGETDLLYYFLVKFADPTIIPDIHTVMFYDLYEDAGGAYHHENFDEHRAYLLERMAADQPAVYLPETAYWVSFDVSVPLYLPLYVRNRQLDLERLRADPAAAGNPLDGHVLFSTGWEWGYWLNDYTALRASYQLDSVPELVADAFGEDLAPAVPVVLDLIDLQKRALMDQRLMAYLAGRDQSFEIGRNLGIVSQPDRVTFADLVTADATTRARVAADTDLLEALADELDLAVDDLDTLDLPNSRWTRELRDGVRVTALRARFAAENYRTMLASLDGRTADVAAHHAAATALVDQAAAVVARRHGDLHDQRPSTIVDRGANRTFYAYGYLHMADTVCFWERELHQVEGHASLSSNPPPDCIF